MEKKKFPIGAEHYTLFEEVGHGLNSSVYRALCIPRDEIVAVKIVDCERDKSDLNNISHEAQIMILVDHPNVLKSHCSFVSDHSLWVVMPYMTGGSCLHILKVAYPGGFEEVVIATVLREVLKALDYLHDHGYIHRDVKAGNILIDSNGAIKLGDLGVSACLFDSGDRQRTRNTFVGTPCWMAPEVMEQLHGYDFKADIWSFGITALELAHGHAPFSKYPPIKVLLLTLQNAPPGLDYESDDKFTKSFKRMIASCLVKDPLKRPSTKKLLKHSFFKEARSNDYIARTLLKGLPVLGDRLRALKRKEVDMLEQQLIPDGQKEKLSQNEYRRGISNWNFNLEDVKAQASIILDEDSTSENDLGGSSSSPSGSDRKGNQLQCQHSSPGQSSEAADISEAAPRLLAKSTAASYKGKYEKPGDDMRTGSSSHEQVSQNSSPRDDNQVQTNLIGNAGSVISEMYFEKMNLISPTRAEGPSDGVTGPDFVFSTARGESVKPPNHFVSRSSINGLHGPTVEDMLSDTNSKGSNISAKSDELDEKAKQVVQQKGRFKVTSDDVYMEKVRSEHLALSVQSSSDAALLSHSRRSLFPMLQSILHSNIVQRDVILNLLKQLPSSDSKVDGGMSASTTGVEKSLLETMHDREKELLDEVTNLQWRLICAQEELKKYKTEDHKVDLLLYDFATGILSNISDQLHDNPIFSTAHCTKRKRSKISLTCYDEIRACYDEIRAENVFET